MHITKTLSELAALVEGELVGDPDLSICGLNDVALAGKGEITFLAQAKFADQLAATNASAVIIPADLEDITLPAIRVKNPYLASALIHTLFYKRPVPEPGIHSQALIGNDCLIASSASVSAMAVLGDRVKVGENAIIESGVVIGDDVVIGDNAVLEANSVVRFGCKIGKRAIIYSGAVIGSDGFGYATDSRGVHIKRPQVGNVVLEDDVEIGANACIDRATFGTTLVKKGTKIDNLVQVGHNVQIGEGCFMVSQSGIAGSSKLGSHVVLAGQAAVGDHVEVGDRVTAAGRSGINSNVKADQVVAGFPAIPYKEWLRAATSFSRIPQLIKDVRQLRKEVREMAAQEKPKEK